MASRHSSFLERVRQGLKETQERNATFRARTRYVCGRLRAEGFPEIAKRLESGLVLLSGPGNGDKALDEVEALLEVLTGDPGDRH